MKTIGIHLVFYSSLREHLCVLVDLRMVGLDIILVLEGMKSISTFAAGQLSRRGPHLIWGLGVGAIDDGQFLLGDWFLHLNSPRCPILQFRIRQVELPLRGLSIEDDKVGLGGWFVGVWLGVHAVVVVVGVGLRILDVSGMLLRGWKLSMFSIHITMILNIIRRMSIANRFSKAEKK